MKGSDWQAWVDSLPSDPAQLHNVYADLERQAVIVEARLTAVIWQGRRAEQRAARVELNDLNSQLLFLRGRMKAA